MGLSGWVNRVSAGGGVAASRPSVKARAEVSAGKARENRNEVLVWAM